MRRGTANAIQGFSAISRCPLWRSLNRLHLALRLTVPVDLETAELPLNTNAERSSAAHRRIDAAYNLPPTERNSFGEQAVQTLDVDLDAFSPTPSAFHFQGWEQVREMAADGSVTFGSHDCSHAIVSQLRDEGPRGELTGSKNAVAGETGLSVRHLAYPDGTGGDWDERAIRLLSALGYTTAGIMRRGLGNADADRLELPRVRYADNRSPTPAKWQEDVEAKRALRWTSRTSWEQLQRRPTGSFLVPSLYTSPRVRRSPRSAARRRG